MDTKIIEELRKLKPILKEKYGIEEFAVFGSTTRKENTENSDVDIVILSASKKDFFSLINAKIFLEEKLNKKIDIGDFNSMKTFIKNRIRKEMIYV